MLRGLLFLGVFLALVAAKSAPLPTNVTGIISGYGYPVEEHLTPPTSDGWQLVIHRIPYGKAGPSPRKGVVFFQHGLTDCSAGVNLNFPYESLSFILADNGYDVWMGNNRGNGYSMKNIYHDRSTRDFWDFSFDEMADIDLPAMINYVLSVTKKSKLSYIGHSEGTIQAFAGLLDSAALVSKLNLYVALAPVAYVQYVESVLVRALADLHTEDIFILLGDKEFSLPVAIEKVLPGFCKVTPRLCQFIVDLVTGPTTFFNDTRSAYYLHYEPNPTSVKNMAHWAQCVRKGTFEKYDYGKEGNIQHYNQPDPPQYDLRKFPTQSQLPLALFTGGKDYLADPKDVQRLLTLLPTPPLVHTEEEYAHLDPLLGINAYQRIYPLILKLLAQYGQN